MPPDRRDPTRVEAASARQFDAETALPSPGARSHPRRRRRRGRRRDASRRRGRAAGRCSPGQDRLAERRRRVRVAIEQARVAIGEELVAIVDEEQRRLARPRRPSSTSRSRPARRAHPGRASPASSPGGAGRTTRRSRRRPRRRRRPRASAAAVAAPIPSVARAASPPAPPRGPGGDRTTRQLDARQHVPEHREVAVALDPAADERRASRPAGDLRREAPDRDARHRRGPLGGDRTAVEDRHGQAGRGVVEDHDGVDRRQPAARCSSAKPATHFIPTRSSRRPPVAPRRWAGIACTNDPSGRGWTPIFGGSSRIGDERGHRPLGQLQALGERRHRGRDVGRGEVADRAPGHPGECTRHLG